jgi:hypothetical protein
VGQILPALSVGVFTYYYLLELKIQDVGMKSQLALFGLAALDLI